MQDFFPQLIRLNIPFIFLLLIGALSVTIAYYLYRKTNPELSKPSKYMLITIRSIIFFLVVLLFLTPSFLLTYKETKNPKVALFVDNSKSMGYETGDYKRWPETLNAFKEVRNILPPNIELSQFTFNSRIDTISNGTITVSEGATNFSSVVALLKKINFNKAVIISDGNHTESNYPIEGEWPFDTRIFTVGIGEISSGIDLAIKNVIYQPVTYLDNENKIEIQMSAKNLEKNSLFQLDFYINDKLIQQKQMEIPPGSYNQSISIMNVNTHVGLNKVRLVLHTLEGETNVLNNKYTFVQNVLDSKIKIGIFAGMPSYDSKFVAFLLKQVDDLEIQYYTERKNGQFYNQTNLNAIENLDVLIFIGFPGKYTLSSTLNRIINVLRQKQPSLFVYLNQYSDQQRLLQLLPWLPYEQLPGKVRDMEISIINPLSLSINPLLYIFDNKEINQEFWSKVPPVIIHFSGGRLKGNVKTLLTGSDSRNEFPIVLLNDQQYYRSVILNGEGFWEWHFLVQDNQRISNGYQKFLINMLRWANDRTQLKPVILKTKRNVVNLGEPVQLTGSIYDATYQPVKDGELIVNAEWNQQKFSIESTNDSTGNYLIEFVPPGEGKYTITAKGFREGIELGNDRVEIEVIPIEKEFIHIDQNVEFLKKLADMGNGFYMDASEIDSLKSALIEPNKVILKDSVIDIWYHPVLLAIIIMLISVEWILRKRMGLA